MPIKLKPSSKEYVRDSKGKMTNKFHIVHYTVSNTKTEELLSLLKSKPKKKSVITKELIRRGIEI
jgi:hypothetical protein